MEASYINRERAGAITYETCMKYSAALMLRRSEMRGCITHSTQCVCVEMEATLSAFPPQGYIKAIRFNTAKFSVLCRCHTNNAEWCVAHVYYAQRR